MSFGMEQESELRKIDVRTLLPQREPFVLIDRLVHYDEVVTTTEKEVRADDIYVEGGVMSACALVENIAQTCAARMGYINAYITKDKVRIGFIGSVRNMEIRRCPKVGEVLTTSIEVKQEVLSLTLVEATVKVGGEEIVRAEMKIALTDMEV